MAEATWQKITSGPTLAGLEETSRLRVDGGWIYRSVVTTSNNAITTSMVFVPERNDAAPR